MRSLPALVAAVSGLLAVLLAGAALLVAEQSAPTEPAAAARAQVAALLAVAGLPAADPVDDSCPWLGLPGLPASEQVRPTVRLAVPVPADPGRALDAAATALRAAGVEVDLRAPAALVARDVDGYELSVDVGTAVAVRVQAPCVWPAGERAPG